LAHLGYRQKLLIKFLNSIAKSVSNLSLNESQIWKKGGVRKDKGKIWR
jgi:hypothetical protein